MEAVKPGPRSPSRLRRLGPWAIGIWIPVTLVPLTYLMGWHLLTLPMPQVGLALEARLRASTATSQWRVLHVLAQKCGCSARVFEHLVSRGAKPDYAETVLFIGDSPALSTQARSRGFAFENISAARLKEKYGIEGAPLLVVMSPDGAIRYSGGYSASKQGPVEDGAIFADLAIGRPTARRPLFGCAVSKELQQAIDPLHLKYALEIQ